MRRIYTFLALALVAAACGSDAAEPGVIQQWDAPPELTIDQNADYEATIETNVGSIDIALFADSSPVTVNNFVFLAQEGFFDGVLFHRVVPGFVIQAGDPTATGTGGPGYRFEDELNDPQPYRRGIVAMANAGPNTNGSQFFIVLSDAGLPYQYSIFGEVTSGLDVVDAIAATEISGERPVNDIVIESVTIAGP